MNEPIGSVQPVVLLKKPVEIVSARGQEFVLDRIDARIDAGECVALMGPSGSGKSTLMNIIGCLDRPTSGDYLFCGREVGRLDDDELSRIRKSRIGFVFQNFNLLPRLTAAGNVELPLVYAGVSRRERHDRAMELLGRVGLMDRAGHRPASCREARSSALPSHGHWSTTRPRFWRTSRPAIWTAAAAHTDPGSPADTPSGGGYPHRDP